MRRRKNLEPDNNEGAFKTFRGKNNPTRIEVHVTPAAAASTVAVQAVELRSPAKLAEEAAPCLPSRSVVTSAHVVSRTTTQKQGAVVVKKSHKKASSKYKGGRSKAGDANSTSDVVSNSEAADGNTTEAAAAADSVSPTAAGDDFAAGGIPQWQWRPLVAMMTAALVYSNSLNGDFVFNDTVALVGNPDVVSLEPTDYHAIFLHDFWGQNVSSVTSHKSYQPLVTLSFRANYVYGFKDGKCLSWGFHFVNLVLHAIASAGVYFVSDYALEQSPAEAGLAAALFATHPVHTEAVSGIVGRADIMATLFAILAFLAYVKAVRPSRYRTLHYMQSFYSEENTPGSLPPTPLPRVPLLPLLFWLLVSIAFCVCSFLSKEVGITIIGVMFAYEWTYIFPSEIFHAPGKELQKWENYWGRSFFHFELTGRSTSIRFPPLQVMMGPFVRTFYFLFLGLFLITLRLLATSARMPYLLEHHLNTAGLPDSVRFPHLFRYTHPFLFHPL